MKGRKNTNWNIRMVVPQPVMQSGFCQRKA
jgi:hypothetical protein